MERSRVTVEYSHLPGQVFEHEANGVYCVTRSIGGRTPDDVTLGRVLEALEHALEIWSLDGGVHAGFPPAVTDHEDEFRLITPGYVDFDVSPATLFCSNPRCGHVLRVARVEDLPGGSNALCAARGDTSSCRTSRFMRAVTCASCSIPACEDHPRGPVGFEDSASFYTAGFRCLTCRRPLKVEFRFCACRLEWRGGGDRSERSRTPVTARDTRAFFGHHLTMVSVGGPRLTDAMRSPKRRALRARPLRRNSHRARGPGRRGPRDGAALPTSGAPKRCACFASSTPTCRSTCWPTSPARSRAAGAMSPRWRRPSGC